MLIEQQIDEQAEALLNTLAFVTTPDTASALVDQTQTDWQFNQLVASLISDAARAAEQAAVTVRPRVGYVRLLTPPSCSRCAILAGRVYRYSQGFLRHPGCDCVMLPTTVANAEPVDPMDLVRRGQVTGLSKADRQALADGADLAQVVNIRRRAAGLRTPDGALVRAGRLTPAGIYARTSTRDEAIDLLVRNGYVR